MTVAVNCILSEASAEPGTVYLLSVERLLPERNHGIASGMQRSDGNLETAGGFKITNLCQGCRIRCESCNADVQRCVVVRPGIDSRRVVKRLAAEPLLRISRTGDIVRENGDRRHGNRHNVIALYGKSGNTYQLACSRWLSDQSQSHSRRVSILPVRGHLRRYLDCCPRNDAGKQVIEHDAEVVKVVQLTLHTTHRAAGRQRTIEHVRVPLDRQPDDHSALRDAHQHGPHRIWAIKLTNSGLELDQVIHSLRPHETVAPIAGRGVGVPQVVYRGCETLTIELLIR